jgi:uncharacterized membrane protein
MITVTIYICTGQAESEQALIDLQALQETIPHRLVTLDIASESALSEKYGKSAPVVEAGPYQIQAPFSKQDLQVLLGAARDRSTHLEAVGDQRYNERLKKGHIISRADSFSFWLSNHYMLVFNLIVLVYVGLPFMAPVLMKAGADGAASVIYKIYSVLCHQLAFRSWFLFGEQPAYPRALAQVSGWITYEQATGFDSLNLSQARAFLGNAMLGFKIAICERDVAIYGSILLFGLVFSATGRKMRSLPWYVWLIVGIVPIAIDGFSQLPSLTTYSFLAWLPMRESTPLLRTITGGLFGFTTAWFGYPYVEESMLETRSILARKKAVVAKDAEQS